MASIDFHKLRVAEVKRETPDAVSVRFELPEALREAFAFKACAEPFDRFKCH